MGVTIYYNGVLKSPHDVHALISETSDIARTNQWKSEILDDSWDHDVTLEADFDGEMIQLDGNSGLKGIILHPHPSLDGLSLLFDRDGICRSLREMAEAPEKRFGVSHLCTQEAGVDLHIQLVRFLQYIGGRYMQSWHLEDDSGYVLHGDRNKAEQVFDAVGDAINAVAEAFDTIEIPEDLTGREEEFLSLVESRIRTYLPGAEIQRIDEDSAFDEEE